ncbi:siderochrome-iron transporter [Cryptococcus deuterogattii 99/473]|uniref:Unplaced genomic scaffold supercont1.16, whole genome shotgun sequence n=1 Tax=Cryptococcus deuterogattii Ram5 TaxID=1296110 RepID=A0A0D0V082_9TREE|nr:siderochrome-iron transporter [Cryptococcus deuterogattii Ram5]KIY58117.1 siderochrome-iron transporter [Cryptococcus deuterogattii 99/473]
MSDPHRQQDRIEYDEPNLPSLNQHEFEDSSSEFSENRKAPLKRGITSAGRILSVITKKDIRTAYLALTLLALGMAFAQYTETTFTAYATSAFKSHSELAAAGVVARVFSMVTYLILPKVCDNVGRISPWIIISMLIFTVLSDAMMAGCKNVQTYIGANVFSGLSGTGYTIALQIYYAETTAIRERALWNVAADSFSAIITLYSGSSIGGHILDNWGTASGWRWGYGMWSIINTVLAIPFIAILFSWRRRARHSTNVPHLPPHTNIVDQLFHEYDLIGSCLLVASVALILIPLTLAKGVASKWTDDNIAMICVGFGLLVLFIAWSTPKRWRPKWLFAPRLPLIPWYTLKNRSLMSMFVINMCDFMSYGAFTTYFQTFLQVAVRTSASKASMIDNTLRIVFQVTALVVGLVMRFWTPACFKLSLGKRLFHTRYPVWIGIPLCALSIGIDINFVQHPRRKSAIASYVIAKAIYGVGRGMFQTSAQITVQASSRRVSRIIADYGCSVAVAGAVWLNTLPDALAKNLPASSVNLVSKIYGSITVAISYDPNSEIGLAILKSYVHTMKILAIVATCLQIPMLISMFFIEDLQLTEDEQIIHAGKRIGLGKEKQEKVDEREGKEEVKIVEKEKPVVKADKASLMGDDS